MSAQECTKCAAGSYSLGSGVRFDEWDAMPAGFTSLPSSVENGPHGDSSLTCNRYVWQSDLQNTIKTVVELVSANNTNKYVFFFLSCSSAWLPQGSYLESNRDECTVSLIYAVHLKKQGSVSFEYQYPDNNLLFEFFVSSVGFTT